MSISHRVALQLSDVALRRRYLRTNVWPWRRHHLIRAARIALGTAHAINQGVV